MFDVPDSSIDFFIHFLVPIVHGKSDANLQGTACRHPRYFIAMADACSLTKAAPALQVASRQPLVENAGRVLIVGCNASRRQRTPGNTAGLDARPQSIAFVAFAIELGLRWLQRRLVPWYGQAH